MDEDSHYDTDQHVRHARKVRVAIHANARNAQRSHLSRPCTQLSRDLDNVPFPSGNRFALYL
jgi:hypothetical protein